MTTRNSFLLALVSVAALVGACAGGATPSSPPASSSPPFEGTVDTPEEAVAAVVAFEPRFAGISPVDPDVIGQSSWYTVTPASGVGAYIVEIRVGWGDCQAGCIDEHVWTYVVQPDGSVALQSERGDPVPGDAWPKPTDGGGETGISGVAVAGPTCPVETVGDPACAPRQVPNATIVVVDAGGADVGSVVTGLDGAFFIALPAGDYTLTGWPVEGLMGTPDPTAVTVTDGAVTEVQLSYDTGIR
jgi:hypothetical protein